MDAAFFSQFAWSMSSVADDCALHVRKATVAETPQREIYQALGNSETPGGTQKTIIEPR